MKYKVFLLFTFYFVLCASLGCDAFVRKFTRKPKTQHLPQEELVLTPEEYVSPQVSKEDLYRQYFLFWKSWTDELVGALSQDASLKKQIDCLNEARKNLVNLKPLLNEAKQKELEGYISQLDDFQVVISRDLYGYNRLVNARKAEQIKRNILRDFSYNKVKIYVMR